MALMSFNPAKHELKNKAQASQEAQKTPTRIVVHRNTPSIKIRHSMNRDWDEAFEDEPALEEHYAFATLRMYHRIIDYRNRHPITYDTNNQEPSAEGERGHCSSTVEANATVQPSQQPDCDEIFDMDL
jgi:hypothetical protein